MRILSILSVVAILSISCKSNSLTSDSQTNVRYPRIDVSYEGRSSLLDDAHEFSYKYCFSPECNREERPSHISSLRDAGNTRGLMLLDPIDAKLKAEFINHSYVVEQGERISPSFFVEQRYYKDIPLNDIKIFEDVLNSYFPKEILTISERSLSKLANYFYSVEKEDMILHRITLAAEWRYDGSIFMDTHATFLLIGDFSTKKIMVVKITDTRKGKDYEWK